MTCPCLSGKSYAECCEPIIKGSRKADTAEALMRARYTAYALGEMAFIKTTLVPEERKSFDMAEAERWSKKSQWLGLQVLETQNGGPTDKKGVVEFVAKYSANGETVEHHEIAQFRKDGDDWLFVDGDAHTHKEGESHHHHHGPKNPVIREQPKIGRNDPCLCGSGKKFKKCCGVDA